MSTSPQFVTLRPDAPLLHDLPWNLPLDAWKGNSDRLEDVPRGLSRHPIVFINDSGVLYALKELRADIAEREYNALRQIENANLPVVYPVGFVTTATERGKTGILITRYLDRSLPYRTLFMQPSLARYRQHLLDAIAGLLVQLHLAGVYWGDCSLSNTLFRRDAGKLQAYLVDAETVEFYADYFPPTMRAQDLEIMEENINGDLMDLNASGLIPFLDPQVPLEDTGAYIRLRYQSLWDEITREDLIDPAERYRIHERIRALNDLGFSVGDVELAAVNGGDQLRLRVLVTDRNFHRDQLYNLTGLDVEERQARKLVNEIQELKATLSRNKNRSTPMSVAAFHWLETFYLPTVESLSPLVDVHTPPAELYCQVLEHKWYLSERAQHDVGHQAAVEDYLKQFGA